MSDEVVVSAWELPRDFDLRKVSDGALEGALEPDFHARVVSSREEILTLQLAEGSPPTRSHALVYVAGRGPFELVRREDWPGGRILLTLSAWKRP